MGKRGRPGTGVEALADTIRISFTLNGERCRETLDLPPTNPNLKYATRLVAEIKDKIRLGVFDYAAAFPNSKRVTGTVNAKLTFKAMSDLWLNTQVLEAGTRREYKNHLRFWSGVFGDKSVDRITTMEIRKVVAARAAEVSAKTVNNSLNPLRGVFKTLVADNIIERDPTATVKSLKHQKPPPDPFDRMEMERILGWMQQHAPVTVFTWYVLAFLTGLRPSEQRVLRRADVVGNQLRIERAYVREQLKPTKTFAVRHVDLSSRAVRALTYIKHSREYLFSSDDGDLLSDHDLREWLDSYWYPCLDALGLRRRISYHTRHTYATINLMAGVNPAYISRQMGHKNMQMLLTTYSRWIDEADRGRERAKMEAAFVQTLSTLPANPSEIKEVVVGATGIEPANAGMYGTNGEET